MRRDEERRVASLEPARGLAMMTGYGDRCSKKPQGPNKMKMTTEAAAAKWNYATYGSPGEQPIASKIERVHLCKHVCARLIARRRFLEGCRAIGLVHQELKIKPRL